MGRRKGEGRRNVRKGDVMSVRRKRNLRMKGRMRSVNRGLRKRKFRFVTKTGKKTKKQTDVSEYREERSSKFCF